MIKLRPGRLDTSLSRSGQEFGEAAHIWPIFIISTIAAKEEMRKVFHFGPIADHFHRTRLSRSTNSVKVHGFLTIFLIRFHLSCSSAIEAPVWNNSKWHAPCLRRSAIRRYEIETILFCPSCNPACRSDRAASRRTAGTG